MWHGRVGVADAVVVPGQFQILDHLQIFFVGAAGRGKVIADQTAGSADVENPALQVAQVLLTAARHLQVLMRQDQPHHGDDFQDLHWFQSRHVRQRRPRDREQEVQRHDVGIQFLETECQTNAILNGLAHAEDAAAARLQADPLRQAHRVHALLPGVRRHDLWVELARGFQVVIDAADAGVF